MRNTQKSTQVVLPPLAPRKHRLKVALMLAPFMAATLAGAQSGGDVEALASIGTSGANSVKTAVIAVATIVVTIGLLIWASRHLKPKG